MILYFMGPRPTKMAAAVRAAILEAPAVERLTAAQAQGLTMRHMPRDDVLLVREWAFCRQMGEAR